MSSFRKLLPALCVLSTVGAGWAMAPGAQAADPATSASSSADDPSLVPDAPRDVAVREADGSLRVTWADPAAAGDSRALGYDIAATSSDPAVSSASVVTTDGDDFTAVVPSLVNGVSYDVTVTAKNEAGSSPPASATGTPRAVAHFVISQQPARRVVYGTPSVVRARLVAAGVGVPAQKVELLTRTRLTTRWRRVAEGTTNRRGRITLSTTLPASASLRLRHPAGAVAVPDGDARSVIVAKRVTVAAGRTRTRLGMPVVVRGRINPRQRLGSRVHLQRRVSGSWVRVASGHMVTGERFAIRWKPDRVGRYVLRVTKRGRARLATGRSRAWHHRVKPESALDIARDILRNDWITLEKIHLSGGSYLGSAHQNIVDVAHGRRARHSCHDGAPCGSTRIELRVLRAVRDMGTRGRVTVSEFAGGVHSAGSAHYSGRAVDINWVNRRHVGWGADYGMVVERCRAHGASRIFTPSNDPYGGHHNHVHCSWE